MNLTTESLLRSNRERMEQVSLAQITIDGVSYLDGATILRLFNISNSTLYRMRKNERIPYTQFGRLYLYPVSFFTQSLHKSMKNKHLL